MLLRSDKSKVLGKTAAGVSADARGRSTDPFENEWDEFVIRFDREKGQFDISTAKTDEHPGTASPLINAKKAA